jgi:HEAT repeat protein
MTSGAGPSQAPGAPDRPDAAQRRRSAALAGHQGDAAAAVEALTDDDPAVRATALGALRRLGRLDATLVQRSLTDPSPIVRRRAAELAAGDRAVSLLGALDDRDPTVVEVVAFACGEQGRVDDPDGAAVVIRLAELATGHDDALVREAAVAALGAIGDPAGLPAILAATADKATVRRRAIIALAPFEGPGVDAALARASTDRDWQVRQAAEDQLSP